MNKGVQAYRNARYAEAVEYFKKPLFSSIPRTLTGKLYLATAYMTQYVPGVGRSQRTCSSPSAARDEFNAVLKDNPNDKTALASLASLSYQEAQGIPKLDDKIKKLDESKDWNMKLIQADPQNKEAYYSSGRDRLAEVVSHLHERTSRDGDEARRSRPAQGQKGQGRSSRRSTAR